MKKTNLAIIASLLIASNLYGAECFNASGKAFSDAQKIRKVAKSMGWIVNKPASMTAGSFIKGKKAVYPQDVLEVCLRSNGGKIQFRAQSMASDAANAEWRNLYGKRN